MRYIRIIEIRKFLRKECCTIQGESQLCCCLQLHIHFRIILLSLRFVILTNSIFIFILNFKLSRFVEKTEFAYEKLLFMCLLFFGLLLIFLSQITSNFHRSGKILNSSLINSTLYTMCTYVPDVFTYQTLYSLV